MIISITYRNEEVKAKELKVSSSGRIVRLWVALFSQLCLSNHPKYFKK